jgi:molybdopterin/thiamine biosynthesis adenylyltransferase
MATILVTGSCGLIGSEITAYFARLGFRHDPAGSITKRLTDIFDEIVESWASRLPHNPVHP